MSKSSIVVAIVDDDPGVLAATGNLLAAYGFKSERYASAEAFLAAVALSQAACLVLDVDLAGISGLELACRLSQDGFRFPVIFATGRDDEATRRKAADIGCVAFLRKPFFAGALFEALINATQKGDHC